MTERLSGRKLQRLRARLLRANPLCVACAAKNPPRVALAIEIDHVVALMHGGGNEDANLRPLCRACHVDKTAADKGHRVRPRIGADGYAIE